MACILSLDMVCSEIRIQKDAQLVRETVETTIVSIARNNITHFSL